VLLRNEFTKVGRTTAPGGGATALAWSETGPATRFSDR
jgi:hypothetical protein